MYRRDFMKLGGLFSAAALMQINSIEKVVPSSLEAEVQGKLYRGTADGRIYVSSNRGGDWKLHTNFGSHVSIYSLTSTRKGQIHAELGLANHSFALALAPDGRRWKTV